MDKQQQNSAVSKPKAWQYHYVCLYESWEWICNLFIAAISLNSDSGIMLMLQLKALEKLDWKGRFWKETDFNLTIQELRNGNDSILEAFHLSIYSNCLFVALCVRWPQMTLTSLTSLVTPNLVTSLRSSDQPISTGLSTLETVTSSTWLLLVSRCHQSTVSSYLCPTMSASLAAQQHQSSYQ